MGALGVVAALPAEAGALTGRRHRAGGVVALDDALVCVSGIGAQRASRAARGLLERGAACLASWGIAGGLDPALGAGHLLLPERVLVEGGEALAADGAWRDSLARCVGLPACSGPLVQTDAVLADAAAKRAVLRATEAAAVDMESGAIAAEARRAGVPFVAIRAVCDAADVGVVDAACCALDPSGRPRPLALLASLCRRPGQVGDLLELRRAFRAALATLRRVARAAGPGLLAPVDR